MTHDEIATAMGISTPTLRKYFAFELSQGAYGKRQAVIEAIFKTALKGNASAQKTYLGLVPQFTPLTPDTDGAGKDTAKAAPKGKKEQAKDDARTAQAGTQWDELLPGPAASTLQ